MNYDGITFHNVEALRPVEGKEGLRLQRVPEEVRMGLSENGQGKLLSPVANVELRFILEGPSVKLTLSAGSPEGLKMFVFWSGFQERAFYTISDQPTTIQLSLPDRYVELDPKHCQATGYAKKLVRCMFTGNPDVALFYHGHDQGDISLPSIEDTPKKRLLAYGTSITHGAKLSGPHLTYPYQTARHLGMDVINLGAAGAAFCEKAMADHIAARQDWDVVTLGLSVNMYSNEAYSFEQFKERASYMVKTIAEAHPNQWVFCITLFPFFDDVGVYREGSSKNAEAYRQALRDLVAEGHYGNVHLLEGKDLLTDFTLLAPDLIHPNDMGMIQIANNLSKSIKEYL